MFVPHWKHTPSRHVAGIASYLKPVIAETAVSGNGMIYCALKINSNM
jgi:hypothetical protein